MIFQNKPAKTSHGRILVKILSDDFIWPHISAIDVTLYSYMDTLNFFDRCPKGTRHFTKK